MSVHSLVLTANFQSYWVILILTWHYFKELKFITHGHCCTMHWNYLNQNQHTHSLQHFRTTAVAAIKMFFFLTQLGTTVTLKTKAMGCATRSENQKENKERYKLQPLHKVFIFL